MASAAIEHDAINDKSNFDNLGVFNTVERNASALRSGQKATAAEEGLHETKSVISSAKRPKVTATTTTTTTTNGTMIIDPLSTASASRVGGMGSALSAIPTAPTSLVATAATKSGIVTSAQGAGVFASNLVASATDDEFVTSTSSVDSEEVRGWDSVISHSGAETGVE